jgi:phage terminase large subunit
MDISIPFNWEPRDYQMPAWLALEGGINRGLLFWHRRSGKDLFCVNYCMAQAMQRIGAYWHIFPTYKQGRKIAWEGKTKAGRPFVDHFPKQLIDRVRDQEMTLNFRNGSSYHIIGADDPDSQVGTNPVGMIFSVWAVMQDPKIWQLLQPILVENDGWAIFITTPRGRNHAYRMLKRNETNPKWFCQVLGADDTIHNGERVVSDEAIKEARAEGMTEDMVQQEFYCSFDASLENAYYGPEMRLAASEGRITQVPYDPALQVETWWDLGMSDQTSIWFVQHSMGSTRMIDYEFASGQSLAYYADLLNRKREKWHCTYRTHLLPHDAKVRELGTGKTRIETLRKLGIDRLKVVKKTALQDGIQACRSMIQTTYFDEANCVTGIEGLRQYVKKPIEGAEDPDGNQMFSNEPVHNWASHPADSFRTGAIGSRAERGQGDETPLFAPMAIV